MGIDINVNNNLKCNKSYEYDWVYSLCEYK